MNRTEIVTETIQTLDRIAEEVNSTPALASINKGGCGFVAIEVYHLLMEVLPEYEEDIHLLSINYGDHFCVEWLDLYIDSSGPFTNIAVMFDESCEFSSYRSHKSIDDIPYWIEQDLNDPFSWNWRFDRANVPILQNIFKKHKTKLIQWKQSQESTEIKTPQKQLTLTTYPSPSWAGSWETSLLNQLILKKMCKDNFESIRAQVSYLEMTITGRKMPVMKFRNEFKRIRNKQKEVLSTLGQPV